jgi:hypothetical protein
VQRDGTVDQTPASPKTKRPAPGASPKGAQVSSPWGKLSSKHPDGSFEADDDLETQAFVRALRGVAAKTPKRP